MPTVNLVQHNAPDAFLDALVQHAGRHPRRRWMFRGHASAEWKLLPTALRPGPNLASPSNDPDETNLIWQRQIRTELVHLDRFARLCGRAGLWVPDEADRLLSRWRNILADGRGKDVAPLEFHGWPHVDLHRLLALAQHHGLATRLLDWSHRPQSGAYFAASEAAEWQANGSVPKDAGDHLAVWALDRTICAAPSQTNVMRPGRDPAKQVYEVNVAAWGNAHLRAQAGSFTVVFEWGQPGAREPLEQQLDRWGVQGALTKFTLPHSQAPALLRLLEADFATAATVFPTYTGVAKATQEYLYWDQPAPELD